MLVLVLTLWLAAQDPSQGFEPAVIPGTEEPAQAGSAQLSALLGNRDADVPVEAWKALPSTDLDVLESLALDTSSPPPLRAMAMDGLGHADAARGRRVAVALAGPGTGDTYVRARAVAVLARVVPARELQGVLAGRVDARAPQALRVEAARALMGTGQPAACRAAAALKAPSDTVRAWHRVPARCGG